MVRLAIDTQKITAKETTEMRFMLTPYPFYINLSIGGF